MNEQDEFNLMCEFMGSLEPTVELRDRDADTALTDSDKTMLRRIALGESNDSERSDAVKILCHNPVALEFLAHQLND